jgi:glycosyltransferase involved in cell wall biosynthesis
MKILIVSEMSVPYAVGGGEVRYGLLARELVRRGHDVTWLSMRQRESPDDEIIDGVRCLHRGPRIRNPPNRPLAAMVRFMFTVFFHILAHRYDIIDTQTYAPLPPVWLACLLSRQKMVATIHDTSAGGAGSAGQDQWLSARDRWIVRPIENLIYRLPYRRIVTVSRAVAEDLVRRFGVSDGRVAIVPNGIDSAAIEQTPAAATATDLLFVGRVIPHKHVDDFLRAVAGLNAERSTAGLPPVRGTVVGPGPGLAAAKKMAVAMGLEVLVEFTGGLVDHAAVIGRMKSARVLVFPSTREGFGLTVAEALAAGTPVVAYDIPAIRETLGDGAAGMLVPPRDLPALTAAIGRMLADDVERERHVACGRQKAAEFSTGEHAERMLRVYSGLGGRT